MPAALHGLLAWIACIADALPVEQYADYLTAAGLTIATVDRREEALLDMARRIQGNLLGLDILTALKRVELPGLDLGGARKLAAAVDAIKQGRLGYALITAAQAE